MSDETDNPVPTGTTTEDVCFVAYDIIDGDGETISSGEFPYPYMDGCDVCHPNSVKNEFSAKIVRTSGCSNIEIKHLPTDSICLSGTISEHGTDECMSVSSALSPVDECSEVTAGVEPAFLTEAEVAQINQAMASFSASSDSDFVDIPGTRPLKVKLSFIPTEQPMTDLENLELQAKLDAKPSPHDERYKGAYTYHEEKSWWETNPSAYTKRDPAGYRWSEHWAQELYNKDLATWKLASWPPIKLADEEWWVIQPASVMAKRDEQTQCFTGSKVYVEPGKQWKGHDLEDGKLMTFHYRRTVIDEEDGEGNVYKSHIEEWTEIYKVVGKETVTPYQDQYFENPIDYAKPLQSSTKWIKNNSGVIIYPTIKDTP
tara:strand:+ start:14655 stop:15770 length:1116 start_codon:yes stop_codon:yes gene_type:complete